MMGDNRGGIRRQPILGPGPEMDHRRRLLHLLAARPDRHPLARTESAAGSRQQNAGLQALPLRPRLGMRFVAGADEAGRGCLAGPLVAAAVLFDLDAIGPADLRALPASMNSKRQTPAGRAALYPVIRGREQGLGGLALRARDRRARAARHQSRGAPRCARERRLGWLHLPVTVSPSLHRGFEQRAVGGDATSAAIAAASVIAKETRDRYMRRVDTRHPGWEFSPHVGYATPEHRDAIERLGVTPAAPAVFQVGRIRAAVARLSSPKLSWCQPVPPGSVGGERRDASSRAARSR